jgi:hypothetical protein
MSGPPVADEDFFTPLLPLTAQLRYLFSDSFWLEQPWIFLPQRCGSRAWEKVIQEEQE